MIKREWKSFGFAFKGLKWAWSEPHFRFHVFAAIGVTLAGFYFQISPFEWMMQSLLIGAVLSAEIFNTAIEEMVDWTTKEHNAQAGRIKDLAAGAVLVLTIAAAVVGLLIYIPKIFA